MESAIPLHRQYAAFGEQFSSFPHGVADFDWFASCCGQVGFGSAGWTCHGLGMKPPIRWVLVLFLAEAAEGELAHGGVFSVVWQPLDDGEAGSAVGAGYEEVVVAGVFGSRSSLRHWLQMAMSGGMIEPECSASWELWIIVNLLYSLLPESSTRLIWSILASGGFSAAKSAINCSILCASPSSSTSTPASPLFCTYPAKPCLTGGTVDERTKTHTLHNTRNVEFNAQRVNLNLIQAQSFLLYISSFIRQSLRQSKNSSIQHETSHFCYRIYPNRLLCHCRRSYCTQFWLRRQLRTTRLSSASS